MGYVYAVQFDDLSIKVGQAIDPVKRITTHQREAARFGLRITQIWSASVPRAGAVEDRLIAHCLSHGTVRPGTREYFTDVPWDNGTWDTIVDGTPEAWDTSRCPGTEDVPADCPTGQEAGTERAWDILSQMGQRDAPGHCPIGTEDVPGDRSPLAFRAVGDWDVYVI